MILDTAFRAVDIDVALHLVPASRAEDWAYPGWDLPRNHFNHLALTGRAFPDGYYRRQSVIASRVERTELFKHLLSSFLVDASNRGFCHCFLLE